MGKDTLKRWSDEVGKGMGNMNFIYSLFLDQFAGIGVGPEILHWFKSEDSLPALNKATEFLAEEFKKKRVMVLGKNKALVNLDASPKKVVDLQSKSHIGSGWVLIEKREEELFIESHKVSLYFDEKLDTGLFKGYEIYGAQYGDIDLHSNILDVLLVFPHFVPKAFKGKRLITFNGTGYEKKDKFYTFVRALCFCSFCKCWKSYHHWSQGGKGDCFYEDEFETESLA